MACFGLPLLCWRLFLKVYWSLSSVWVRCWKADWNDVGCGMPTDELPVTNWMKSWCFYCKCYEFLCLYQISGSSTHCWGLWALLLMLRRRIWQRGWSLSRYSADLHLISLSLVQDSPSFVLRISASGTLLTQFLCDKHFLAPEVVEEMQSPAAAG